VIIFIEYATNAAQKNIIILYGSNAGVVIALRLDEGPEFLGI